MGRGPHARRPLGDAVTALVRAADRTLRPPAQPPDPDEVVQIGLTLAEVSRSLATMLALVFFWLVEHARLQRYVLAFLPADRRGGAPRRLERGRDAGSGCGSAASSS